MAIRLQTGSEKLFKNTVAVRAELVMRCVFSRRLKAASVEFRLLTGPGSLFQADGPIWQKPGDRIHIGGTEMFLAG